MAPIIIFKNTTGLAIIYTPDGHDMIHVLWVRHNESVLGERGRPQLDQILHLRFKNVGFLDRVSCM